MFLRNQLPNVTILLDGIQLKYHDVAYFPDERMDDPYFALFVKQHKMRVTEGPATVDINGPIVTPGAVTENAETAEAATAEAAAGDNTEEVAEKETTTRKRSAKK